MSHWKGCQLPRALEVVEGEIKWLELEIMAMLGEVV